MELRPICVKGQTFRLFLNMLLNMMIPAGAYMYHSGTVPIVGMLTLKSTTEG